MHHVLLLENVVGLEMLDLGHCFQKPPSTHCVMFPHLALLSCDSLTKHHKLGDLKNRHWSSHSSRGWKSQIKVAGRVGSF